MVSVIISPVQNSSGSLAQLERELYMTVKGGQVAREAEVTVGSIWAVHQKVWFWVEVVIVSYGNVDQLTTDMPC